MYVNTHIHRHRQTRVVTLHTTHHNIHTNTHDILMYMHYSVL